MAGVNRIVRTISQKSVFESAANVISSAVSFNQGDFLYFNTGTSLLSTLSAEANAATFVGIARSTIVLGKLVRPVATDVDASAAIVDVAGPVFGVEVKVKGQVGQTFTPGCKVYAQPTLGNYHVSTTGTKEIGVYQGASVTATASTDLVVILGSRYPNDTLEF